jgi:hypothetical protein
MKIYDLVKKLLEENQRYRDSDKELIWAVWQRLGFATTSITKEQFLLDTCPLPESIRRCRQNIQEHFPNLDASEGVKRARRKKEKEKGAFVFREEAGKKLQPIRFDFVGDKAIPIYESD